jgi:hypothetical protein
VLKLCKVKVFKNKCVAYPQEVFLFEILHSVSLIKKYVKG